LLVHPGEWVLPHGWVAGRYRVGDAQLYVNRGFGTVGPPVRIGAPPEVTRIVLSA
jgi:predicted MPP superfamily phosphohydrolase